MRRESSWWLVALHLLSLSKLLNFNAGRGVRVVQRSTGNTHCTLHIQQYVLGLNLTNHLLLTTSTG